ncbi:MAG: mannose-6-phosphate isomerase, class I [Desulfobacterales bacterium]
MRRIGILKNTVQPYAWGSHTAIAELLGVRPEPGLPQAELWMGAHPKAPSRVAVNGEWLSLEELVNRYPQEILGRETAAAFGSTLPYLFKVLAAARPLSLQAHPSLDQAREGFERENARGVPLDSPQRNYRDARHKPECICALTPFWALHGFRRIPEILALAGRLELPVFEDLLSVLRSRPDAHGLKLFFKAMMTLPAARRTTLTAQALDRASRLAAEDPVYRWMGELGAAYPGDIGLFAPILLNLVLLQPGQALYLPAAELHAYLEGTGIELMANSDNVLRGGLTPKHVDVAELLRVLNFEERTAHVLAAQPAANGESVYECPAREFVLSAITVVSQTPYVSPPVRSVEILLCTAGSAGITDRGTGEEIAFPKGRAVLVPAAVKDYTLKGEAVVFKAAVPIEQLLLDSQEGRL